ncbi:MAG: hypothetical protein ACLSVD_10830 [Eggerthellaceae bacterium]
MREPPARSPTASSRRATRRSLHGCEIPADKIATLVDEVPVLALVAAHARGDRVPRGQRVRVKETDRLAAIVEGPGDHRRGRIDGNDLYVEGQPACRAAGRRVRPKNDHRLAMTWALAGLCGNAPVEVSTSTS